MDPMTTLSRRQFECALRISSTKEAAEALVHYPHFHTLADALKTFSGEQQPKNMLVEGLLLWFPEKF